MRDWLKIVLGVGIGAAVALTIALPIVLTGDDLVIPDDPGKSDTNCRVTVGRSLNGELRFLIKRRSSLIGY